MCDTIYLKKENKTYFGKNSDRSCNEAHLMIRVPAKDYKNNEMLKATYIQLPQVKHTYGCVLFKPHWIWGAEMGWNEFGLNIGNEAIFTNVKRTKNNGLIGMDLLRLALERCKTPSEAVDLITDLIYKYGQEGNCGYGKNFYYDNAFLIANKDEAFVLETAGKTFVVKKANDVQTISNCISIEKDYESCSDNFRGNFKKTFQNNLFTKVSGAEKRAKTTSEILRQNGSPAQLMIKALKSHDSDKVTINKSSTCSVCMHAGNLFGDQTTGSYFGEIDKCYFVTGSSFPCLSIFKPLSKNALVLPESEEVALKYWLKREKINRNLMSGNLDLNQYLLKSTALEAKFVKLAQSTDSIEELEKISAACFEQENLFVEELLDVLKDKQIKINGGLYFKNYWNKKAKEFKNDYEI